MAKESMTLVVDHIRDLGPGVRHIGFRRDPACPLSFKPGQFMTLLLDDAGGQLKRNYSIATIPDSHNRDCDIDIIEIALTYVENGRASEQLFAIKKGDRLPAVGPSGRLILHEEHVTPRRLVLVATGTGVSPYRAMLPQFADFLTQDSTREIELIFGIRTPEHVLYESDFIAFAEAHSNFTFHCCYSRQMPTTPSAYQHSGYVQHFLTTRPLSAEEDIVYLCGNPAMIDEAYAHLKEEGFTVHNVRREKYISAR